MGIESEGYVTINLASSGPWNYLEVVEDESFVDFVLKDPEGLNEYPPDSEGLLGSKNIEHLRLASVVALSSSGACGAIKGFLDLQLENAIVG